jgi:hypothetical protein
MAYEEELLTLRFPTPSRRFSEKMGHKPFWLTRMGSCFAIFADTTEN